MTKKRNLSNSSNCLIQTDKMLVMIRFFEKSSKEISVSNYSGVYDVKKEKIYPDFFNVKVEIDDKTMEKLLTFLNKKSHPTKCSKSKREIRNFLVANKKRGLSRKEIMSFLGVSKMNMVEKIFLENKISIKLTDILVDLRKRKLEGEPIIPVENDTKNSDNSKVTNNVNAISDVVNKEPNGILSDVQGDCREVKTNNSANSSITSNSEEGISKVSNKSPVTNDIESSNNVKDSPNGQETSEKHKKVIKLRCFFDKIQKIHNYIMDLSILEMSTMDFITFLDDLIQSNPKEIPVFWLYRSDFEYYDKHKDSIEIARNLIKFFSLDDDRFFSRLINQMRPEKSNLIKLCSENEITLITGNYINIIKSKLNNVDVIIPRFFKEKFPTPLNGDKVYGFDSSAAIALSNNKIANILKNCKRVIISDIQYEEIQCKGKCGEYFSKIIAYYGEIYKATNYKDSDSADSRIVKFYKQYPVNMVFTDDFGFKLNGEFNGVNCSLINDRNSTILQKLNKCIKLNCNFFVNGENLEDRYVKFDCFINNNGKFDIIANYNNEKFCVTVFNCKNKKRIPIGRTISMSNGDVVCIRAKDAVLISVMTDCKNVIAKVWYFGKESNVPNKYKCYLV